jgi:hypothetical protein
MKLPLSPFLAVVGVLIALQSVDGSIFGRSVSAPRRWTLGMRKQSAFGLARNLARGGAVEEATEEGSKEESEPDELYLPGLLEAIMSRTTKVRLTFFLHQVLFSFVVKGYPCLIHASLSE